MEVLLLRLDAPLMSFGSVMVDQQNRTDRFPYKAMLTGLLANALGYERSEVDAHIRLQSRLCYAVRVDRAGEILMDFHTVDLSENGSLADGLGWTTHGRLEGREGGTASSGTLIRQRYYLADSILTAAVSLDGPGSPTLHELDAALRRPARPLFLGRKCCLPGSPIALGLRDVGGLVSALESEPRIPNRGDTGPLALLALAKDVRQDVPSHVVPRTEDRDWVNSIHVGRRIYREFSVNPPDLSGVELHHVD